VSAPSGIKLIFSDVDLSFAARVFVISPLLTFARDSARASRAPATSVGLDTSAWRRLSGGRTAFGLKRRAWKTRKTRLYTRGTSVVHRTRVSRYVGRYRLRSTTALDTVRSEAPERRGRRKTWTYDEKRRRLSDPTIEARATGKSRVVVWRFFRTQSVGRSCDSTCVVHENARGAGENGFSLDLRYPLIFAADSTRRARTHGGGKNTTDISCDVSTKTRKKYAIGLPHSTVLWLGRPQMKRNFIWTYYTLVIGVTGIHAFGTRLVHDAVSLQCVSAGIRVRPDTMTRRVQREKWIRAKPEYGRNKSIIFQNYDFFFFFSFQLFQNRSRAK